MDFLDVYRTSEWFESLKWQHRWIEFFVGWYVGHFGKPLSVIDFGAGDGWWPHTFRQIDVDYAWAVELDPIAREFIPDDVSVTIHDLREPLYTHGLIDLVICLEVAEHLPKTSEDILLRTLINHTGSKLLFSAAQPNQRGTGHINLHPVSYWRDKIERYPQMKFSAKFTSETQAAFDAIQNGQFDFLVHNMSIFARI